METLAVRPRESERIRSFDLLANVDAMRSDLDCFGKVLPETREQVTNEQLSFLVEAANRAARTPFTLSRDPSGELVYFDEGKWRSYGSMVEAGRQAAEHDALVDPRRRFLSDWAQNDYSHYLQMRKLSPGEKYSWSSSYAHDEHDKFGAEFMAECGLQPNRRMGFLYQASCQEDGSVLLESQTVDQSDPDAILAAMDLVEEDPTADLDVLVDAHDQVLEAKFGGRFYAGRRNDSRERNAWNKILASHDLTTYLIDGLEKIAAQDLPREVAERKTKRHIYGVWALFKKRLDGMANPVVSVGLGAGGVVIPPQVILEHQVNTAFNEFVDRGQVMSGCGGAISFAKGEKDILNASPSDVFESIFSGKAGSDKYGSLEFDCPHCHKVNTRSRNKLIKSCKHCHKDVQCK